MPRNNNNSSNANRGKGYIGRIGNTGAQRVEAPIANNANKGKTIVKTGDDLRTK